MTLNWRCSQMATNKKYCFPALFFQFFEPVLLKPSIVTHFHGKVFFTSIIQNVSMKGLSAFEHSTW